MKGIFHRVIDDKLLKDKPDGEILIEDHIIKSYLFGIKIYEKKYDYVCSMNNKHKETTGFK